MAPIMLLAVLLVTLILVNLSVVSAFPHEKKLPSEVPYSFFASKMRNKSIKGQYVVVAHRDIESDTFHSHVQMVTEQANIYNNQLFSVSKSIDTSNLSTKPEILDINGVKAYTGKFNTETLEFIKMQGSVVDFVEEEQIFTTSLVEQKNAPWGIARLSHGRKPGEGNDAFTFTYPEDAGKGTHVYVVDSGVRITHSEFEGTRAIWGGNFCSMDPEDVDGNGHGTHVAGTIAGKTYGVAKSATVVAVKVLSSEGYGTTSDILRGMQWVYTNHKKRSKSESNPKSVVNMSLGGGISMALDLAVQKLVEGGIHVVVAAGNEYNNACESSPGRSNFAVTTAATDIHDRLATFSNHGRCVDILAPGVNILSSWSNSDNATNIISGTSMASPHVAGVVASHISMFPEKVFTHAELVNELQSMALKKVVKHMPGKGHHDGKEDQVSANDIQNKESSSTTSGGRYVLPLSREGRTPNLLAHNIENDPESIVDNDLETTSVKSLTQTQESEVKKIAPHLRIVNKFPFNFNFNFGGIIPFL